MLVSMKSWSVIAFSCVSIRLLSQFNSRLLLVKLSFVQSRSWFCLSPSINRLYGASNCWSCLLLLFYFTQLKPDRKYQGLLAQITSLESEKAVAESKINQLQLDMSNEAAEMEKAHKERDDLKAEVSKLQLEVKGQERILWHYMYLEMG